VLGFGRHDVRRLALPLQPFDLVPLSRRVDLLGKQQLENDLPTHDVARLKRRQAARFGGDRVIDGKHAVGVRIWVFVPALLLALLCPVSLVGWVASGFIAGYSLSGST
jgi:hypothetical protein